MNPARFGTAFFIGGAFAFLSTRFTVGDSDAFWQLATARDFLMRGLGQGDTFSWTAAGQPVATDQWLGQLLLYVAYSVGGWQGVDALRALAVGALAALTVGIAFDARPNRPLLAVVVALPALFVERFVAAERPELLGFVCFVALLMLLRRAQFGSDRAMFACVPLIALWANVHGSFALGVVLMAFVAGIGAIAEPGHRRIYVAAVFAGAVASLATPAGFGAWTAPGLHFTTPPRFIQEWAVPDVRSLPGAIFALSLAAVVFVAFRDGAKQGFARWREAVILVPLLFLSLSAQRQLPYFVIAAVPYIAARFPLPSPFGSSTPAEAPRNSIGRFSAIAAAVFAGALLVAGVATGPTNPDLRGYPVGALGALPAGPGTLAEYDWGGYLILAAPRTPMFVDGRLVPYLGPILDDYRTVVSARPGWREVIARRGVRTLLLRPSTPVAVRATELGWPTIASGEGFVVIRVP